MGMSGSCKDVNLIVASLVRTTGVVSTCYLYCCIYCLKISIWQLFFGSSQYQILNMIDKGPKH